MYRYKVFFLSLSSILRCLSKIPVLEGVSKSEFYGDLMFKFGNIVG